MELVPGERGVEFYLAIAAVTASLLASASCLPPADNVLVEVKLEKELHLITKNSTESESENNTFTKPFECAIHGLTKDELALFADEGKEHNVILSTKSGNYTRFKGDENEISLTQPFNVELIVKNDSLLVKGFVRMEGKPDDDLVLDNATITSCEVLFLDADNSSEESGENVTSRHFILPEEAPIITSDYDHVVLMNGAPEQVISCKAQGNPPPKIWWSFENENAVSLSPDSDSDPNSKVSYLLFSQVDNSISGNYTCIAENDHGRAIKTFEVEVISVEAIAHCAGISVSPSTHSKNHAIIFNQNIHNILRRSKRHLWYQWRTTKIYIPPFNRPLDPYKPEDDHNTDLQKLVNFITERLLLADKVAVNKWDNNLPVEDLPREQIILENMVRLAQNRGLEPDWAVGFFRDQIEANKDIQYELLRIWQIEGLRPPGPPVDLANEVRPEIDRINGQLVELAKNTERERQEWKCKEEVEKNARYAVFLYNLDPLHQKTLQKAIENVCIHKNLHDQPPFHPHPPPDFSPY